jgi:competence protein ComEC
MLIRLAIAWMLGIVAAHYLEPSPAWLWAGACLALACALIAQGALRQATRRPRPTLDVLLSTLLCLLCAALGALRYGGSLPELGPAAISGLIGQGELTLAGAVESEPRRSDDGQRVVLRVESARVGGVERPAEGLALVVLPPFPAYGYGARLAVTGELQVPRGAERTGDFDYRSYLAHRGIFALMREPAAVRALPGRAGVDRAPAGAGGPCTSGRPAALPRALPRRAAALPARAPGGPWRRHPARHPVEHP